MHDVTQRDAAKASPTRRWLRALELTANVDGPAARILPDVIEAWADRQPEAPALLSDRESLTYAALADRTRRYARWARAEGFGPGAVVALLLPGRPDVLAAWLGITRTGATVALLNPNLRGAALAHAVAAAAPAGAIVDVAFGEAWASALPDPPRLWWHGAGGLDAALAAVSGAPLDADERAAVAPGDRALLIYTSGTTGLPKAANVSHRRIMTWSHWFAGLADIGPQDRMYDCLPLHHSVGGVVAPGCLLAAGGSVVIRDGFSASAFWSDIARWDCTLVQYIGDLCRYLLRAPAEPGPNRLRLALGNGLGADIWEAFRTRFALPEILEFYAATEGSFSLSNVEGRVGSVGRVAVLPEAPLPRRRRPPRSGDGAPGPRARRAVPARGGRRTGRGDRRDRRRGLRVFRRLYEPCRQRRQGPARRVRPRRPLVPDRRPDADRCGGVLLFRRPDRRHVSLEGRERRDDRGRGRARQRARRGRGRGLWRVGPRP